MLKDTIFNGTWWDKTLTRMIYTAAESALATVGTNTVGITDLDLLGMFSVAAGGALIAMLISLADMRQDSDPYAR